MLKRIILYILLIPAFLSAQEFTLKKIPEEQKIADEKEKEELYLSFQEHFFNAILQKEKEDYSKAIEMLEQCKQLYPNDAGVNFELAKNYLSLKDYENAIYFDYEALKSRENNTYVLEHLKKVYKKQRDFKSAIEIQEKIIAINPKKKSALISLYIISRQRDKAKNLFLQMKKDNSIIAHENYYNRVFFGKKKKKKTAKVITAENTPKSITELQKAFTKRKDYKTLRKLLIEEEKAQKYKSLVNDSKKGLELFPAQPFLYLMQGKAENKLFKYNEAIDVLKVGLDFIMDNIQQEKAFYYQLNVAYKGLNNNKEASKYFDKYNKLK